jgi:Lon protease-like protein
MTRTIPLFPLPGVVLLPGTLLPLHVFEPRYREMVEDALSNDRLIGMAMLKPGVDSDQGESPVHAIGGAGEIIESEKLEDGRYNILLEARFRYRILDETASSPYRVARVEPLTSHPFATDEEAERTCELATRVFGVVRPEVDLPPLPDEKLPPERLASEIALRLRYSPQELQAILETNSLASRFSALIGRMMEWEKRIEFLAPFRPPELDVTRN